MYWVIVLLMTVSAMCFIAWRLISNAHTRAGRSPTLWILAFIVPLLGLGLASFLRDHHRVVADSFTGLDSIAWPGGSTMPRQLAEETVTSAAPVSSLVTGLRARLDENPDDVKGWALLAQSYAFMADGPGAEAAIAKAVELGFDEADLRNRVELAFQSSRPSSESESTGSVAVPGIIHGVVKLAADADVELSSEHRVFVFAKAMDGSTIPVAVIRRRVNEFPFTFALSNRESMAPGVSLTDFEQVVISARLSASGMAERGDGDIESNAQIVRVASPDWVELEIGG